MSQGKEKIKDGDLWARIHGQPKWTAENLNQETVGNAGQWGCRKDGCSVVNGLIVRFLHQCSGARHDRMIKNLLCIDAQCGIRPH